MERVQPRPDEAWARAAALQPRQGWPRVDGTQPRTHPVSRRRNERDPALAAGPRKRRSIQIPGVLTVTDLSTTFAEQQSNVIEWNSMTLYGLYEFDSVPDQVRLEFLSSKPLPVQGVQLRIRGGVLEIDGVEATDFVLWTDSAPSSVAVAVRPTGRGKPTLKLWNIWRGGLGVTQAWLGNAAIQVEGSADPARVVLRCSDGEGEPDFDDLVMGVTAE